MEAVLVAVALVLALIALRQVSLLSARVRELEIQLAASARGAVMPAPAAPEPPPSVAVAPLTRAAQPSRATVTCSNCRASLERGTEFCGECGARVRDAVPPPNQAAPRAGLVPGASEAPPLFADTTPTYAPPPIAAAAPTAAASSEPARPAQPILKPLMDRVRTTDEWEALIGGRWMNRIGALALILGLAFFFKYAVDNNWISQGLRVVIGLVAGAIMLAGARRSHQRDLPIFAQGLVGAGLATLYLSIYASANFYHLIPQPVALAALALVIGLAFAQALWYDSLAVALLAWAGGFATVPLLGIRQGSEIGTIGYVLLLDAGILAIVARRDNWFILEPLALGASYLTFFGWYLTSFHSSMLVLATIALTLIWALFYGMDVWRVVNRRDRYAPLHHGLGAANAILSYAGMAALLAHHATALGLVTLAFAAVYIGTILATKRGLRGDDRLDTRYALTAILLAVIATPILAHGFLLPILWSVEALALLAGGVRWKLWYVWGPALVLYAAAAVALLLTRGAVSYVPLDSFRPVINPRALAFLILAATLVAAVRLLSKLEHRSASDLATAFRYAWETVVFLLLTVETVDLFGRWLLTAHGLDRVALEQQRLLALAVVWMCFSVPLTYAGLRTRIFPFLSAGVATAGLSIGLGAGAVHAYQPIEWFIPLLNHRAVALILLIAGLALQEAWLRRHRGDRPWMGTVLNGYRSAIVLLGFELISAETIDYFGRQLLTAHGLDRLALEQERLLALAAVWMLYSLLLAYTGLRHRIFPFLTGGLASAALAVGLGAGTGLAYQPIERFIPALNGRAAVMLLLIAGLVLHQRWLARRKGELPWIGTAITGYRTAIVLLGFELISAEIHDYFRHASGSISEQAGPSGTYIEIVILAAIWMLYSFPLVRYGIRNRSLAILLTGLGSLSAGTGAGAIAAAVYQPTTWLSTALTLRPIILVVIAVGLLLQMRWLREAQKYFTWLDSVILALQACTVLVGFELITAQTRDVYDHRVASAAGADAVARLRNLEQVTMSVLWLGYAIAILVVGFWRRLRWLRLGAIALLGFILLKIVAYDLSFLNPGFRSLSFVGLGLVLLAASYLYQRYRGLLLEGA